MDRNRKTPTPMHNPNASLFFSKNSASKKSSSTSKRLNLNETVCGSARSFDRNEHPKIKFALPTSETSTQILETECDLVYNDYLQALIKQEIMEREVKQQAQILKGQMKLQNENLKRRKDACNEIMKDIDLLEKKIVSVELIDSLESKIARSRTIYSAETKTIIEKVVALLKAESDEVIFRNVKPITTQEECDELMTVLEHLNATMEKILKSGRDLTGINDLGNEIKHFFELSTKVNGLQTVTLDFAKDSFYCLLQTMSDIFAKQYIDSENNCE